jgi:hypothetical protein
MNRGIKVKGVWRQKPEVGLYVLALIELARQLQGQEQADRQAAAPGRARGEAGDA